MSTLDEQGTPITNSSSPPPSAPPQPSQEGGKYARRTIKMIGRDDCGHCVDAENYFKTELIPNSDVPVEFNKKTIDDPEAKAVIEAKNLEYVPYIEHCLIPKNPNEQPVCEEFKSFKKSKFKQKVNSDQ